MIIKLSSVHRGGQMEWQYRRVGQNGVPQNYYRTCECLGGISYRGS